MPPLSLMIKPASSLCNLSCEYCFYKDVSEHREHLGFGVMEKETAEILKSYLQYRDTLNLPREERALFISSQNKRMMVRAMQYLVKKYAKIATPLKNITHHKLRSTYGTNLYKETKDIYIVAEVLGHKDVNTTKKHYAAISDDIRKSVAGKVKLR
jgi:site-specific recombinase XerD